ncbi:site-specific integrase [Paraburkholderia piptadeniae]|uniref:site-specific integrase n=1 Tax=Paraburkholderia piptadeniae TaxID=1701573 RepID=UPI001C46F9F0|nr:site-specific integrase [Paraburkholderia piptadeniae]
MATLEHIRFVPYRCAVTDGKVDYVPLRRGREVQALPQIFWADHTPWKEANLWAVERFTRQAVAIETIESNLRCLASYAAFLEAQNLKWFAFPIRKEERCLVRYRGALVEARNDGLISPSTATMRMRQVIHFYRWVQARGLFSPASPIWRDRIVYIRYFDSVGFERTLARLTTDLAIPNRTRPGERLEDGLLPVSATDRDAILDFARENATPELFRILSLGFFAGLRLGTICDLRVETLERAVPDPLAPGLYRLAVGPGASPPVHTKFAVTGQIWIPQPLLDDLREYAGSVRRLMREARATQEDRNLLFLTRFGNGYGRRGSDRSAAVNVEMSSLRRAGMRDGLGVLRHFHMHQTRCTFATELARLAIAAGGAVNAVAIVKDALLHRDEATSFRYIRFLEKTSARQAAASAFMAAFTGIVNQSTS